MPVKGTHMKSHTTTYRVWASMIQRCTNPNRDSFRHYGGRGITVCKDWLLFSNFLNDMGERPKDKTLDRINNDKGYSKENCRWATVTQQKKNTRNSYLIKYKNNIYSLKEFCQQHGLPYSSIFYRVNVRKIPLHQALKKQRLIRSNCKIKDEMIDEILFLINEEKLSQRQVADIYSLSESNISMFLKRYNISPKTPQDFEIIKYSERKPKRRKCKPILASVEDLRT